MDKTKQSPNEPQRKFIVQYKNDLYDITKFQTHHPGGVNTLSGLNNKSMDVRFDKGPTHSPAALYLLKEYKINESEVNQKILIRKLDEKAKDNIDDSLEVKKHHQTLLDYTIIVLSFNIYICQ